MNWTGPAHRRWERENECDLDSFLDNLEREEREEERLAEQQRIYEQMPKRGDKRARVLRRTTTLATSPPESMWMLAERYVKHYPTGWQLVFRRGDQVLEVSVDEEVWRAFDS